MKLPFAAISCAAVLALTGAAGVFAARADESDDLAPVVIWGGQEHREPASLEAWLRSRGASYETWAERHPAAAARLAASGDAPSPVRPAPRAAPAPAPEPPTAPVTPAASLPDTEAGSSVAGWIVLVILGLGLALLVLAGLIASPLIHALRWNAAARKLRESSVGLALAGGVMVVSVAVAYAL